MASPGEANVAIIRALFDEFAQRSSRLAYEVFDEEITWDARTLPLAESRGVFHGHEGVRRFWRTWLDAWERTVFFDGPHHRAHGNQVISWWRSRTEGRTSGLEVEQQPAIVWTFENGRIVRASAFWAHDDAFRAIGLER